MRSSETNTSEHCCGSVTFGTNPDLDPAIFVSDLQDGIGFFCLLLSEASFTSLFKDKKS